MYSTDEIEESKNEIKRQFRELAQNDEQFHKFLEEINEIWDSLPEKSAQINNIESLNN